MNISRSLFLLAAIVTVTIAVMAVFKRSSSTPVKETVDSAAATRLHNNITPHDMGSESCTACHAELCKTFASHPMALSTRPIKQDDPSVYQSSLPAVINGKQRQLTVEHDADKLVHSERAFDSSGQLIYTQPHTMEYVVGSGRIARAYLERRGELLFMSPVNWYRQSQSWSLAPSYLPDDIRRFDRRVRDDCLACHSGRPVIKEPGAHIYPDPIFHETSIGCERCHGPASEHIAFQNAGERSEMLLDSIVNPAKLDAERRDAVCYQCHLESAARILRPGRSHLDFQPGMQLSDVWAILDQGTQVTESGHTRSVNHVQQMRDSRCYTQSQGELGCTSCHDPHRVPTEEQRVDFYRQRCLSCHTEQACTEVKETRQQRQNDCVACHMPARSSSNMAHVAQTDHRVLKRPEPTESTQVKSNNREINLNLFGSAQEQLSPEERRRTVTIGTVMYCQRKGMPVPASVLPMLEQLRANSQGDSELLTKLGGLYLDKGLIEQAESCFGEKLVREPNNEYALDGKLEALYRQQKWSASVEIADKMLAIEPSSSRTLAMRADALSHLNRHEEALSDIAKAIEFNPSQVVLRQWQVDQLRALGRNDEANPAAIQLERVRNATLPSVPFKTQRKQEVSTE